MRFRHTVVWRYMGVFAFVLAIFLSARADETRDIGMDEYQSGNLVTAKTYLEKSLKDNSKDLAVRKALVDIYVRLGARSSDGSEEGIYWLERALKLEPKSPAALFALGDMQLKQQNYDDAVKSLLQAERFAPKKMLETYRKRTRDALYYRGSERMGYNDLRGAAADYLNALRRVPGDPWVMLSFGYLEILIKKPASALKKLALASTQAELHTRAEYYSGIGQQMLKHWIKSLDHFRLAVTDPELKADSEGGIAESQFNQAAIEQKVGKWSDAEPRLIEATTLKPNWTDAWFYLGQTRLGLKNGDTAKRAFLQLAALDNNYKLLSRGLASADTLIGAEHLQAGRYAQAVSMFSEALHYDSGRGDAAYYLGRSHDALHDWKAALQAYQKAQKLGTSYVEAGYRRGEILFHELHKNVRALPVLEDIEQRSPNFKQTRIMLTSLYDQLGNMAFAKKKWRKAIGLVEKYFFFHPSGKQENRLLLGRSYIKLAAWLKALKWLNAGYEKDKTSKAFVKYKAIAHVGYAANLYKHKRWRDAVFNFEWARELKYPDRTIEMTLADAYRHLKMYSQGVNLLRALHKQRPASVKATLVDKKLVEFLVEWSGVLLAKQAAQAAKLADEALQTDGKDKAALLAAGKAYFAAGDWATARDRLEKRAKNYPLDQEGRHWLVESLLTGAKTFAQAGKGEKGEVLFKRVLEIDPEDARALYGLGMLYYADGKRDGDALRVLRKVLELQEYHFKVASTMGDIHFRHKRFGKALRYWDEVWEVNRSMLVQDDYLESLWQVAELNRRGKRTRDRLERLQQGAHIARQNALWQWRYGRALKEANKARKAYKYLKKAIDLGSVAEEHLIDFGEVALQFGDWESVALTLGAHESKSPTIRKLVGRAYEGWAKSSIKSAPDRAEIYAAEAINRLPGRVAGWYWQGVARSRQGHWESGITSLLKAYSMDSSFANLSDELLKVYLKLAEKQLQAGKYPAGLESVKKSERYGNSPDQSWLRGEVALAKGEKTKALQYYLATEESRQGWRSVDKSVDRLLKDLIRDSLKKKSDKKALDYMEQLYRRQPQNRKRQIRYATLLSAQERVDEALKIWQKANEIKEDNESMLGLATVWNQKAEILLDAKDWYNAGKALDKAEDWLEDANTIKKGSIASRYWYLVARMEQHDQDWDDATEAINIAISLGGVNDNYKTLQQKIQKKQAE